MKRKAMIHAIGTAVPGRTLAQSEMKDAVLRAVPEGSEHRSFITKIYDHSGIERRNTVIADFRDGREGEPFIPPAPGPWDGPSTGYRNGLYVREAPLLSFNAAQAAFDESAVKPGDITHLVSASCTGFFAPGFDFELVERLGLKVSVSRFHLGFMGCYAALPALRMADALCAADPGARVLVCATELCSIHYRHRFDADSIVSNSLFADGSSAAIVSSDPADSTGRSVTMMSFDSRIIGESKADMTWMIGDHGFEMTLSRAVPSRIKANIARLFDESCSKARVAGSDVKSFAIHPGGRAILDKVRESLDTGRAGLDASYSVLRDFGNMSSATLLFVLDRIIDEGRSGPVFLAAFGPGLTCETGVFELRG